jgi:hypothetical protein
MLALTIITVFWYILIAINPFLPINPFPPDKNRFLVASPTPIPTSTRDLVATWTPTATPTVTPTPPPSFTPTVTPTPGPLQPTATLKPTRTPTPRVTRSPWPFTYEIEYETPIHGCAWMGVAGTVEDIDGNPLKGYPIHVWGGGIDVVINSGDAQMYGDSGWEQFFTNRPMAVNGVFRVQIHSRDNPNHPPISGEIVLNYPGYCSKSLARITLIKNH